MFDALKKHIESTELSGIHVNKATGEWAGGKAHGFEYLTRDEILALKGEAKAKAEAEPESPESDEAEQKSTGKKKGK